MTLPLAAQQSDVSPPISESSTLELIQASQLLQTADPLLSRVIVLLLDKDSEIKSLRADLQSLGEQTQSDSELRQKQYDDLLSKLTASEMERSKLLTLFVALRGSYDAQSLNYQALQVQATAVIADYDTALAGERAQKLGWQIGGITAAVIGADLALKAFTGKDVVEWVITLFKK
jgi:hypothetical protein